MHYLINDVVTNDEQEHFQKSFITLFEEEEFYHIQSKYETGYIRKSILFGYILLNPWQPILHVHKYPLVEHWLIWGLPINNL